MPTLRNRAEAALLVALLLALGTLPAGCPESTPAQDVGDTLAEGDDARVEGDDARVDGEDVPVDGDDVPADAEDVPADGEDVPVDGEDVPADGEDVPADGEDVPADGDDAPADVEDVPADGEDEGTDAGDGSLDPCPDDMVPSGTVCIDRYEASRPDATELSPGVDETRAASRPDVQPWFVNPFDTTALAAFEAACAASGKRLCEADEWQAACAGPAGLPYVYGATFDRETCNCVDTYCDDHCVTAGIPPASCDLLADCGYRYFCFHVEPTGRFPGCTNVLGTYDLNGNVWEIVRSTVDARGFEVRGGAFNCAMAELRVNCTFNAGWLALNAGFRCCKDR
jgi:hypothetical protein